MTLSYFHGRSDESFDTASQDAINCLNNIIHSHSKNQELKLKILLAPLQPSLPLNSNLNYLLRFQDQPSAVQKVRKISGNSLTSSSSTAFLVGSFDLIPAALSASWSSTIKK